MLSSSAEIHSNLFFHCAFAHNSIYPARPPLVTNCSKSASSSNQIKPFNSKYSETASKHFSLSSRGLNCLVMMMSALSWSENRKAGLSLLETKGKVQIAFWMIDNSLQPHAPPSHSSAARNVSISLIAGEKLNEH